MRVLLNTNPNQRCMCERDVWIVFFFVFLVLECESFTILGKIRILFTVRCACARASTSLYAMYRYEYVLVWRRHNSFNYSSLIRLLLLLEFIVHSYYSFHFAVVIVVAAVVFSQHTHVLMHAAEWPNFLPPIIIGRLGFSISTTIT